MTRPRAQDDTASGAERIASPRLGFVRIFPRDPGEACEVFPVGRVALLGRTPEADIRISDGSVSRRQARVSRSGSALHVEDLGSSHGTFVDGRAVGAGGAELEPGSLLRVGETLLLASADVAPYARPPRQISGNFLGLPRDIWGGRAFGEIFAQVSRIAGMRQALLILGESGSGKEAVARLVHALRETPGPFVALNVAAVPEALFESELFGHVRGAFTGAVQAHLGAFRQAHGGVLFLDEVGDLRKELQVKLLRAIDQMRVRPVGGNEDVKVDVNIVAATSRDLRAMCESGAFRSDLYYRLAGAVIEVPPLRERLDELAALALLAARRAQPDLALDVEAVEALCGYEWEGNVRELEHVMSQAVVAALARGSKLVTRADLPARLCEPAPRLALRRSELTREELCVAMRANGGNALLTAKRLGVSRATLYLWFKRHEIDPRLLRTG